MAMATKKNIIPFCNGMSEKFIFTRLVASLLQNNYYHVRRILIINYKQNCTHYHHAGKLSVGIFQLSVDTCSSIAEPDTPRTQACGVLRRRQKAFLRPDFPKNFAFAGGAREPCGRGCATWPIERLGTRSTNLCPGSTPSAKVLISPEHLLRPLNPRVKVRTARPSSIELLPRAQVTGLEGLKANHLGGSVHVDT